MSVTPSVKNVRVAGTMVAKPVNVRVNGVWQPVQNVTGQLYLDSSVGSYSVNGTLTVQVRENSLATPVNSLQANLTYDDTKLQFVSSDTSGSPFTTRVQNTGGSGSIQIALADLGGSQTGDQLVSVLTFTALASGTTAITFAAGSGIAETSDSSDICNQKLGGSYTIS